MKNILVPFDFSKAAVSAYRFAVDIAERANGKVHLFHVIELPVIGDGIVAPVLNYEQSLMKELEQQAIGQFQEVEQKYPHDAVSVKFKVKFGSVVRTIEDSITTEHADIVIMGSHGASGLKEKFVGSNAEKLVRRSKIPVLIMKEYFKGPIRSIVFPNNLDNDDQSDLVKKVKKLQGFFKAHLHVVWVNTPLTFASDTESKNKLTAFAKRYHLKDFTIDVSNHRNEELGIIEYAQAIKADMVVMGTHSRRGLTHLLEGSLAEDVVNHYKGLVWTYSLKNEQVGV